MMQPTLCITGFTGYVGRHLVDRLIAAGQCPVLIGRPDVILTEKLGAFCVPCWNSPRDLSEHLCRLDDPVIINLAGHFVKAHAPEDIPAVVAGNLTYPTQIFEACALSGLTQIVNVGTSWEFTDAGVEQAMNLYAAMKAANASVAAWYASQFGMRILNLKLNDTYGGDDTRAKLMPALKGHARSGTLLQLGFSEQRLNLLHVDDVLSGILAAVRRTAHIDKGSVEDAFLLADETVSLGDLVARIQSGPVPNLNVVFQSAAPKGTTLRDVWGGAPRLVGWKPAIQLDEGLVQYLAPKDSV